jgi:beta-N-acetylhexosaminidase
MLAMLNGLKQALHDGRLARARVDEAAARILALKMERHLMPAVPPHA